MGKQKQTPVVSNPQGQNSNRFWNFIVNAATETEPASVELWVSGDIIDDEDAWLYEWFGIPAASPNAFRTELSQYAGKDINLWIDSYGGSVWAAAGIYTALMEHKQDGSKITTKVSGKAMSAATIVMMAGDERLMSPAAIFMMHNPLTSASGYASDLRKAADVLDTVKETIINAYQLATGLSVSKIASMMDDETYMSAKSAVKAGFATDVLYEDKPSANDDLLNFSFSHTAIQNSMSASVKKFSELAELAEKQILPGAAAAQTPAKPDDYTKNNELEVEESMEIKNVADLKTQLPDIFNDAYNSGIAAERERLQAFDVLGGKVDPDFLAKAKYEDGATAENVLFKALQEGKMVDAAYVAKAEADAKSANQVNGEANDPTKQQDEVAGILNRVSQVAKKALGIEGGNQ